MQTITGPLVPVLNAFVKPIIPLLGDLHAITPVVPPACSTWRNCAARFRQPTADIIRRATTLLNTLDTIVPPPGGDARIELG